MIDFVIPCFVPAQRAEALLTSSNSNIPKISWWIPFVSSCLLLLREVVLYLEIRDLTKYIRGQEERFLEEKGGGWERTVYKYAFKVWGARVPWAAFLFWSVLILATFLAPFWLALDLRG